MQQQANRDRLYLEEEPKRELAKHDIRHVEELFLERKRATGW